MQRLWWRRKAWRGREQEALAHRAPIHSLHREPAIRIRPGRRQQNIPQIIGEERQVGYGQGDGQIQGVLLRGIRVAAGSRGGHQHERGGGGGAAHREDRCR